MADYLSPEMFFGSVFLVIAVLFCCAVMIISRLRTENNSIVLSYNAMQTESDLLRTRLEIQEHALNTIHNEIQENIGQMLSSVHMKLLTLGFDKEHHKLEAEHLSELVHYMGRSIKDLRNLGHAVNGTAIEKTGLIDAIEKEVIFAAFVYHLQCTFTCKDELPELSNVQDTILFRIVQGMIGYVFDLSRGCTSVSLQIKYNGGNLYVILANQDLGMHSGIDLKSDLPQSIAERIKLMRGNIFMTNQPGKGIILTFTCKLNYDTHV